MVTLWGVISSWLMRSWLAIAKYLLIVLAILAAIWYIRKGGKDAQKLDDLLAGIEGIKQRGKIERGMRRAPDAELDKWL